MRSDPKLLAAVVCLSFAACGGSSSEPDAGDGGAYFFIPLGGGSAATGGGYSATGGGNGGGGATGGGTGTHTFDGGTFVDGGTYGVPVDGAPSWRERQVLVLTNAVRLSPTDYKQSPVYAVGSPSLNTATVLSATYPARDPVFNQQDLNHSARQHSVEMGTFNYFAHESLDAGTPGARIKSYYTLSQTYGENIAAGNVDPIATMHQWLCDKATGTTVCCADAASCDGHRRNIMSGSFKALGVGYGFVTTSTYRAYWTQDFGGVANPPAPPLVDGVHLLSGSAQTRFVANYAATGPAESLTLMLSEDPYPMAVELGTSTRGTWFVSVPRGTGCRPYYFAAVDAAGRAWRYPAMGVFLTTGEATCTQEWLP